MSSYYEITGHLKKIGDLQTFPGGFSKQEFILTTTEENYPQDIKFELFKDHASQLKPLKEGDRVSVKFNIRGNEYKGKYYVNLVAFYVAYLTLESDVEDRETISYGGESYNDDIPF